MVVARDVRAAPGAEVGVHRDSGRAVPGAGTHEHGHRANRPVRGASAVG
ncbi:MULTISPECIES: hypothetical protein [unclassified Streptomyces]